MSTETPDTHSAASDTAADGGSQLGRGVGRPGGEKWGIVPETPTEQMMLAGEEAFAGTARPGATWAEHTGAVYRAMLAAAPEPPHLSMTREEAKTFQRWEGMDGATAWHLIERHAEGWGDIARMMEAWLQANLKTPNIEVTGKPQRGAAREGLTMTTTDAGSAPLGRPVRPVAEVKSARLGWHLPTPDADPVAKFLDNETHPLYDQDALDAAVAAERERCAVIAESWATEETATTCANVAAAIRRA